MSLYLALKEIWRSRGRFLLFSLVIALITTLVLFIAALAGGLATANRQFIDKLEADLLVYQENVDLQTTSSRLGLSKVKQVRRVDGVASVGPLGLSSGTVVFADGSEPVDVSLVGVEPGAPGDPVLLVGPGLRSRRGNDVVIDRGLARQADLKIGDELVIKTIQSTEEELHKLEIVGVTDERQYFFQPSVIVPIQTWDEIRPQALTGSGDGEIIANLFALRLEDPSQADLVTQRLTRRVDGIEVSDKESAIQALPGYSAQQNTLNTQQAFTLFIGVLVVGGFFQIQTLQKVGQIGMLKAIGSSNASVATAALLQIIAVTVIGVTLGGLATLLLSLGLPGEIPIIFSGPAVAGAMAALLLIGPLGGLVSVRLAVKIEPLTAIGLSS
jgi:putative ABC transport system permease protein